AAYRRVTDGQMKEAGLSDHLVLLSLYQTCKYRGVSFLKFLLSREEDVEVYCLRERQKGYDVELESYPPGFSRGGCRREGTWQVKAGNDSAAASGATASPDDKEDQHLAESLASGVRGKVLSAVPLPEIQVVPSEEV